MGASNLPRQGRTTTTSARPSMAGRRMPHGPGNQRPPRSSGCVSRNDLPGLLPIWAGSHEPCPSPQKSRGQKQADVFVPHHQTTMYAAEAKKRHGGMTNETHGCTDAHLIIPWVISIEPDMTVSCSVALIFRRAWQWPCTTRACRRRIDPAPQEGQSFQRGKKMRYSASASISGALTAAGHALHAKGVESLQIHPDPDLSRAARPAELESNSGESATARTESTILLGKMSSLGRAEVPR